MAKSKIVSFSPGRLLLASFAFIIAIGTMLLSLPYAREIDISLIDLFFTSASTTCVTGLQVVPLSHFTLFGKSIILVLMQIGGLGLMTLSFFIVSLFLDMRISTRLIAGQILDFEIWGKVKNFLVLIIGLTISIELIGAWLLFSTFRYILNTHDALFYALFHSVAAFCNAGISLFDGVMVEHITSFALYVLAFLTIAGGLGFIVWYDVYHYVMRLIVDRYKRPGSRLHHLSLHTKIVLLANVVLLLLGTLLIWSIEQDYTFKGVGLLQSLNQAFFCSVSARSSGFPLLDFTKVSSATIFILLGLMFIGASPSSTGSGIKTSTFVLFLATVLTMVRQREDVEIFGRTISSDQLYKAMALVAIACSWVGFTTFILLVSERDLAFIDILFESVSAFATCGFSRGITPQLSIFGKIILIITMIVGRIGSLTLVLSLRKERKKSLYRYPEEKVIIG